MFSIKYAVAVTAGFTIAAYCMATEPNWLTSYDQAISASKKTGKPIFVYFTGSDWCMWCHRLDREVFEKPAFKKWADQRVVLLKLDFPHKKPLPKALETQNKALGRKYEDVVQGFPTILFIHTDGKVFGEYYYEPGGVKNWITKASRLLPPATLGSR